MQLREMTPDGGGPSYSFGRFGSLDLDHWRRLTESGGVGNPPTQASLDVLGQALSSLAADLKRIADKCDPPPPDLVDTEYVAVKLGVSLKRISQMALAGDIPPSCIVPGTGQGKPWKFYRSRIDPWIAAR